MKPCDDYETIAEFRGDLQFASLEDLESWLVDVQDAIIALQGDLDRAFDKKRATGRGTPGVRDMQEDLRAFNRMENMTRDRIGRLRRKARQAHALSETVTFDKQFRWTAKELLEARIYSQLMIATKAALRGAEKEESDGE